MAENKPTTSIKDNMGLNQWYDYFKDQGYSQNEVTASLAERAAFESGYTPEQFNVALKDGYTYRDILSLTTNMRDLTGGGALAEGVGRGLVRGAPLYASVPFMLKGAALGSVLGPIGTLVGGTAGLAAGFFAGDYVGKQLEKLIMSEDPIHPEDRAWQEAGKTVGLGLSSIHPAFLALKAATPALSFGSNLAKSGGFGSKTIAPAGKLLEKVANAATKDGLKAFAAIEVPVAASMGSGAFLAENIAPGSVGARVASEIGFAVVNPFRLLNAIGRTGVNLTKSAGAVEDATKSGAANYLRNIFAKLTPEDYESFQTAAKSPEFTKIIKGLADKDITEETILSLMPDAKDQGPYEIIAATLYKTLGDSAQTSNYKADVLKARAVNTNYLDKLKDGLGEGGNEAYNAFERAQATTLLGDFLRLETEKAVKAYGALDEATKNLGSSGLRGNDLNDGLFGAYKKVYDKFRDIQDTLSKKIEVDQKIVAPRSIGMINTLLLRKADELATHTGADSGNVNKWFKDRIYTEADKPNQGLGYKDDLTGIDPETPVNAKQLMLLRRELNTKLSSPADTLLSPGERNLYQDLSEAMYEDIDELVKEGGDNVADSIKDLWTFTKDGNELFIRGFAPKHFESAVKERVSPESLVREYFSAPKARSTINRTDIAQDWASKNGLRNIIGEESAEEITKPLEEIAAFEDDLFAALFEKEVMDKFKEPTFYFPKGLENTVYKNQQSIPTQVFDDLPDTPTQINIQLLKNFKQKHASVLNTSRYEGFNEIITKIINDPDGNGWNQLKTFYMSKEAATSKIQQLLRKEGAKRIANGEALFDAVKENLPTFTAGRAVNNTDLSRVIDEFSDGVQNYPKMFDNSNMPMFPEAKNVDSDMMKHAFFENILKRGLDKYIDNDTQSMGNGARKLQSYLFGESDRPTEIPRFFVESSDNADVGLSLMDKLVDTNIIDEETKNVVRDVVRNMVSIDDQMNILNIPYPKELEPQKKGLIQGARRTLASIFGARVGSAIAQSTGGGGNIQTPGIMANLFRKIFDDLPASTYKNTILDMLAPENRGQLKTILNSAPEKGGSNLTKEGKEALSNFAQRWLGAAPVSARVPLAREAGESVTPAATDESQLQVRNPRPQPLQSRRRIPPIDPNTLKGRITAEQASNLFGGNPVITAEDILRGRSQ
tara:strand:- start:628 stop:4146 length:3519 start_codon:yes stop_codon:yes gene_type:complete